MFYMDNKEHKLPHIHVEYQDFSAMVSIPDIEIIAGNFQNDKLKLLKA